MQSVEETCFASKLQTLVLLLSLLLAWFDFNRAFLYSHKQFQSLFLLAPAHFCKLCHLSHNPAITIFFKLQLSHFLFMQLHVSTYLPFSHSISLVIELLELYSQCRALVLFSLSSFIYQAACSGLLAANVAATIKGQTTVTSA